MGYLFSLFISSGMIKSLYKDVLFVDPTLVTLILITVMIPTQIIKGSRKARNIFDSNHFTVLFLIFGFLLLISVSAFYTGSPNYWKEKLARVVVLTIGSFLIPFLFFNEKDVKAFFKGTLTIFFISLLILAKLLLENGLAYFFIADDIGDPNYLIWGSYVSYNALLFLGLLLGYDSDKDGRIKKMLITMLYVSGCFLTSAILFISGARGPTIFFILVVLLMTIYSKKKQFIFFIIGLIVFVSIMIFMIDVSKDELSLGRSARILEVNEQSSSVKTRLELFAKSWERISDKPILGYGIGSFSYVVEGKDERLYPHNIILEIWFEAGIFALLFFWSYLLRIFYISYKNIHEQFILPLLCVNILFVLDFMKSSSLADGRTFFAFTGMLYVMLYNDTKNKLIDSQDKYST